MPSRPSLTQIAQDRATRHPTGADPSGFAPPEAAVDALLYIDGVLTRRGSDGVAKPVSLGGKPQLRIGGVPLMGRTFHPAAGGLGVAGEGYLSALCFVPRFASAGWRIFYANYYANAKDELPPNPITVRSAIEYPLGASVRSLAYFNGKRDVVIDPGGIVASEVAAPAVPVGAVARVWTFVPPAAGVQVPLLGITPNLTGDGHERGPAVADRTASGAVPAAAAEGTYGPSAILGLPGSSSRIIGGAGDSITAGTGDARDDVAGTHFGWFERAFASYPRVNVARAGEFALATPDARMRRRLLDGCTDIFEGYGSNNVALAANFGATTDAGLKTTKLQLWRDFASSGARIWVPTLVPRTNPGANAANTRLVRADHNAWLRDGAPMKADGTTAAVGTVGAARCAVYGPTGQLVTAASGPAHPTNGGAVVDIGGLVETGPDTNVWKTGHDAGDQTHPSATGAAVLAAGVPMAPFALLP